MRTVTVNLGARSHQIRISPGLLDKLGELAREALGPRARQAVLVSNPLVDSIFGARAARSLARSDLKVHRFLIGDGERFKNLRTAHSLFTYLIERGIERSDVIVALGGGVVGDLAGFVAATHLRGIRVVHAPTTLLAQIDSSIGGKTGINHPLGKNLIGAFHQPSLVLIDPDTLATLSARQLRAGLYEVVKCGVIADAALFERVTAQMERIKALDSAELAVVISRCCSIKARVVERDERESGLRKTLNFGHTIGHALEAATNYRRFLHGEAVGHGMRAASRIAERIGLFETKSREKLDDAIGRVGKLPRANSLALDDIISAMHRDKKVEAGRVTFVLPVRIGKVVIRSDVPLQVIRRALKDALA